PVMLVPADCEELKLPSEKTTKLAALPSVAHWSTRSRRPADVPIVAKQLTTTITTRADTQRVRLTGPQRMWNPEPRQGPRLPRRHVEAGDRGAADRPQRVLQAQHAMPGPNADSDRTGFAADGMPASADREDRGNR